MMRTMWLSGAWSKADVLRLNLAAELCDVQITWNEEVSNGGNAGMDAVMGGTATLRAQREGNNDEAVRGAAAALRLLVAVGGPRAAGMYPRQNGWACTASQALVLARIDEWVDWSRSAIDAPAGALSGADATAARDALASCLDTLEATLGDQEYLSGETRTLADVAVLGGIAALRADGVLSVDAARHPSVSRWLRQSESALTRALKKSASAASANGERADGASASDSSAVSAELDEKAKAKLQKKKEKEAFKAAKAAKAAAKKKAAEEAANAGPSKSALRKAAKAKASADTGEAEYLAQVLATPEGAKKNLSGAMPKAYSPKFVEAAWYSWWEKSGFFKPDDIDADKEGGKPPFVIVIPPPNVTGSLHLGHALTNSVQDAIVRWRRMCGFNTLWLPGTDHAGIATQTVVERKLQRESGISRHDLGREKFLEKVFEWKEQYGGRINTQLRRLGSSLDWSREAFTMDANLSKAVTRAFLTMGQNGVIYRDNRLVNWCCRLKSAISDIEVDYIDIEGFTKLKVPGQTGDVEFGVLTSFAYPLADGSGEIVVATTRPETMLGDAAVAVHPDDPRYKAMHGKMLVHPFNGRQIPIITDAVLVDMSFGTGAVKITPAHDPNDFATGQRHKLEMINIFTDDGCINRHGGEFEGQRRFEARVTVVDALEAKGLFRGKTANPMRLGLCSRTKDVIEPMLKPQWWVDCKEMAAGACASVRDGSLKIVPSEFEATWFRWLENIRDWCISRQLWWGHRIPAFYVTLTSDAEAHSPGGPTEKMSRWIFASDLADATRKAADMHGAANVASIEQDEDVLDTWFSSGLFPFSTMGWPENTDDMRRFFPNSLLETGHDILFFWVARMVMMSLHLTGRVPFDTVYLHAMVRDAHGRKMSKSLGNVIDPIQVIEGISLEGLHETLAAGNLDERELKKARQGQKQDFPDGIEECGTDALRFALCAYTAQARDINLDIKRVVAYRHWCNKLWNAIRFGMMNLGESFSPVEPTSISLSDLPTGCRWALSRLNNAIASTVDAMESYNFTAATTAIYAFWQYELCDVFIEIAKPFFGEQSDPGAQATFRQVLWTCLDIGLRLLHPFMPFVTEELWQRLPKVGGNTPASIMLTSYPKAVDAWTDTTTETRMALSETTIRAVRSIRAQYGLVKQKPALYVVVSDTSVKTELDDVADYIKTLTLSSTVSVTLEAAPKGCAGAHVSDSVSAYLDMAGVLDPASELQKLDKKFANVSTQIASMKKKMAVPAYETKTPEKVKEQNIATLERLEKEKIGIEKMMDDFKSL